MATLQEQLASAFQAIGTDFKALSDAVAGGGGTAYDVVIDSGLTVCYVGRAPAGTATTSAGWSVTKITLVSPPVVTKATGVWSDRTSLSYS